jgi:hypothetical protein
MTDHYDALETRSPAEREADLFSRLPDVLRKAVAAPAYAERLKGIDPAGITSRAALAGLPVLRKADLPAYARLATPPKLANIQCLKPQDCFVFSMASANLFRFDFAGNSTLSSIPTLCSFSLACSPGLVKARTLINFKSASAFLRIFGKICFAVFTCINHLIVRSIASSIRSERAILISTKSGSKIAMNLAGPSNWSFGSKVERSAAIAGPHGVVS